MSNDLNRESPLAPILAEEIRGVVPAAEGVRISERAFMGHINLRGEPSNLDFLKAVEDVLGVALPLDPNTSAEGPGVTAMWLGPNEWLLLTSPDSRNEIAEALRNALDDLFISVNDLSGGQTVINIRGPHTRDVLSKGCTLDLHTRVFGPGRCAQTNIAKATATIRQLDESPSYDIIVRRSFADYLARWLKDAAREYGVGLVSQPSE